MPGGNPQCKWYRDALQAAEPQQYVSRADTRCQRLQVQSKCVPVRAFPCRWGATWYCSQPGERPGRFKQRARGWWWGACHHRQALPRRARRQVQVQAWVGGQCGRCLRQSGLWRQHTSKPCRHAQTRGSKQVGQFCRAAAVGPAGVPVFRLALAVWRPRPDDILQVRSTAAAGGHSSG